MLTTKQLDLFKIADIPEDAALSWLKALNYIPYLSPGNYVYSGQKCDIGGEITKLLIYRSTAGYHLIQDCSEE